MNEFVMDSFNREDMMFCCNDDMVIVGTDTGVKGLNFCSNDSIKDRFEDYVKKDEFEDLINKVNELYNVKVADKDYAGDAFRLLSRRLSEGNKKKNEISFLNYEKEIRGYEVLQTVGCEAAYQHLKN